MPSAEWFGFIAGGLMTVGFLPQVIRVYRLRSAREISLPFAILLLAGLLCWLAYGIAFSLFPVILWNAITGVLAVALLYAKLKYGR